MGVQKRSSDKSTSILRGEKLKDKEVRATKRVGKWSLEEENQGRRSKSRFSFQAARKMLGNARKNEEIGEVSGGRCVRPHYAMCRGDKGRGGGNAASVSIYGLLVD